MHIPLVVVVAVVVCIAFAVRDIKRCFIAREIFHELFQYFLVLLNKYFKLLNTALIHAHCMKVMPLLTTVTDTRHSPTWYFPRASPSSQQLWSVSFSCCRPCDMELVIRQSKRSDHQQRLLQAFTEDVFIFSLPVYIAH